MDLNDEEIEATLTGIWNFIKSILKMMLKGLIWLFGLVLEGLREVYKK